MKKTLTAVAGALVLSGASLVSAADYVENYKEIVKNADWDGMQTVTVNIDEFSYDANLTFKSGQAYKLELKNVGEKKHYFTAPEFFKNIATRKAEVNDQAEIKADYFTALEILPGGQLDLYFVAHNKGEYEVYCTIDDHRDEGMDDVIVVE
ncbi:hypothetical protein [Motiliproteus sp. SC1-56]|uniref:hypothetical protein n=1 Tax=Motiliproteus sp. SC1-56 TaxID=2799565 RepID=UPI001A8EB2B1|nr:hypothetical protein [Motiliproteus sp. SC1-56]